MGNINKILLGWISIIWIVFSGWIVLVIQFPLNLSFLGVQFITGVVMIWTMIYIKDL